MEVKKDILWRVYLSFIAIVIICVVVFGKAFYIQQVQGNHWRSMSDSLHQKIEEVDAERGTIYSEDGQMLSTSIPQFDIYIDFGADGLQEQNGKRFRDNVDSLSECLSGLFKDKSSNEYKQILQQGFNEGDRHFEFKKNISFRTYQQLKSFPLVRLGKNKSGFIMIDKTTRLNPYKLLAYRTIGLDRDNAQKIGLEQTYDSLLKGRSGRRLVRYIAGGASIPIEDYEIEPETGKDIVTTLDVFIQEVTENALMKMMVSNEATSGCAIVMETKTGKIKAIANLGRTESGNYTENFNYAINPSEPGSTFKLVTMISLLEDKKINLNSIVNLQGGIWEINGITVKDSEQHGRNEVTVKQAFELSSNVGMAKMAYTNYASNPYQFINHIHNLRMDTLTGIDITGERKPVIHMPGTKLWSAISIPWMSFGYGIAISPLQTLVLYNAVANNGKMMKPYLLNAVKDEGAVIKEFTPTVINEKICSDNTLQQLKACLEGVCTDGTAKYLFKNSQYKVAGKTGTAKVSDGSSTYEDKIYQSSFAGFFPADNPQYTIVVVIKNKAHAAKVYGSEVAGPVFKEISDRLYVSFVKKYDNQLKQIQRDSSIISYVGNKNDLQQVTRKLNINLGNIDARGDELFDLATNGSSIKVNKRVVAVSSSMPQLKGMGLKDAIATCENLGLKVTVKGKGKVSNQSINVGQYISKGQMINIELNP